MKAIIYVSLCLHSWRTLFSLLKELNPSIKSCQDFPSSFYHCQMFTKNFREIRFFHSSNNVRAKETSQSAKCLLCKKKYLSSQPQHAYVKLDVMCAPYPQKQEGPWDSLANPSHQWVSLRCSERPGLKTVGGEHELTFDLCAHRHRGVHTRHLYKHKSYRKHSKMLNTTVFDRQFLIWLRCPEITSWAHSHGNKTS